MKVSIDSAACTGHGRCYSMAPGVFDPDDEGFGVVTMPTIDEDADPELAEEARTGERVCPESAVHLDA